MRKELISILIVILAFHSCLREKSSRLQIEVSNISIPPIEIKRYGEKIFELDTLHFEEELKKIYPEFKVFLGKEMPMGNSLNPLFNFITDTALISINEEVQKKYPNLNFLKKELKTAFQHLKYYFPKIRIPEVYTYISGLDFKNPIRLSNKELIIALDLFMGPQFNQYYKFGIPVYIAKRMDKDFIITACLKEFYFQYFDNSYHPKNFLEEIISNAKLLYFMDAMIPEKNDRFKIGYTEQQLNWCKNNEENIWALFIDKQILYSSNYEINRRFTQDGPFTLAISKNAPARIGNWIGWQIIKAYMNNHKEISLEELFLENNAQKILKESAYKPKL